MNTLTFKENYWPDRSTNPCQTGHFDFRLDFDTLAAISSNAKSTCKTKMEEEE